MNSTSLIKPVDLQGLSLALAKTKADYEAKIVYFAENGLKVYSIGFINTSGIGDAVVGTATIGDETLETIDEDVSYQFINEAFNSNALIYFCYYDYFGQALPNLDGSFSAICFKSNDLEKTEGIKIVFKSDGTITSSRVYIPVPEDDENILNLLTEYGYSAPLSDIDGNVITDVDRNLILG